MVTLDALSAYWIASHTTEERGLNVTLSSIGRSGFKSHVLQLNNHQIKGLEEELQVTHSLSGVAITRPGQKPFPHSGPFPEGILGELTFCVTKLLCFASFTCKIIHLQSTPATTLRFSRLERDNALKGVNFWKYEVGEDLGLF